MEKMILILLAFGMLFAGCAGGKKECSDNQCLLDALKNNCQDAVFDGRKTIGQKGEITNKGDTCVVTTELYKYTGEMTQKVTCVYDMPIDQTKAPECTYS